MVKNLPANAGDEQETWVQYLGQKDLLEWEIAAHSSIRPALHQGTNPQFQNTNWLN